MYSYLYQWPPEEDKERAIDGVPITIGEQIFGALSQESGNPFSRISIANSSFSLDPFKGCPLRCSYCIVAGAARDLNLDRISTNNFEMGLVTKPVKLFDGKVLAEALVAHPAFLKNDSIISIGTGSTEAFLPGVENETWEIMKSLMEMEHKNPFWIVTKSGITNSLLSTWEERFRILIENGIKVAISVTYSDAPDWVEPYNANRFTNIERIKNVGVRISHHFRPIIPGINDSLTNIQRALDASLGVAENICIGGLRRDPGVDLAWHYFHGLSLDLLPNLTRKKELPDGFFELVKSVVETKGSSVPVFTRTSEALSHLFNISEYNLYQYRPDDSDCFLLVPGGLRKKIAEKFHASILDLVQEIAAKIGLGHLEFSEVGEKIYIRQTLSYQEHRSLIHALGHSSIFSND